MTDNKLDSNTRFEIKALAFRSMTHLWPPGKDWPVALGYRDEEADREGWREWIEKYGEVVNAIFYAIDTLREEGCEI